MSDMPNILIMWGDDIGQMLQTFAEFPQRQKSASFALDEMMAELQEGGGHSN